MVHPSTLASCTALSCANTAVMCLRSHQRQVGTAGTGVGFARASAGRNSDLCGTDTLGTHMSDPEVGKYGVVIEVGAPISVLMKKWKPERGYIDQGVVLSLTSSKRSGLGVWYRSAFDGVRRYADGGKVRPPIPSALKILAGTDQAEGTK